MDEAAILNRFPAGYWDVPAYLDYVQPPLTDQAIAAAEAQLGVELPPSYLHLLRQQNGGYLRATWGIVRTLFGIGPAFPSITRDEAWWRRRDSPPPKTWLPPNWQLLIPFDGDGHWDICFDYRRCGPAGNPSITFVGCESRSEKPVAESFILFLAMLVDETAETSTRLYCDLSADTVAQRVADHFKASAPVVSDFDHGYPIARVALPGESEWCWCEPNRVPAGFRRRDRRVIATAETALRLPEDPGCTVLLSCTEGSKSLVADALAALGLVV